MVYTIRTDSDRLLSRVIILIIVIVIVVIVVYLLIKYVIIPAAQPGAFQKVTCTAAPAIPTGLSAVVNLNTARVSWNAVSDTDNYILYMGDITGFTIPIAERTITVYGNSIAVLNLLPKTYYFKVVSSNSCGTSALSTEISITVTTWPTNFKICKTDAQTICLLAQSNGSFARVSKACPNTQCSFKYPNTINISNLDGSLCIDEDNPGGIVIEQPLLVETCTGPTAWNINLTTGRISSADGLCLGADDIAESIAYNTTCSNISNPNDARYIWTIQPIT